MRNEQTLPTRRVRRRRFAALCTALALLLSLATESALAADPVIQSVTYLDSGGDEETENCTMLTSAGPTEWTGGAWYCTGEETVELDKVTAGESARLILADGKALTIGTLNAGGLFVYGQAEGTGTLTVTDSDSDSDSAGVKVNAICGGTVRVPNTKLWGSGGVSINRATVEAKELDTGYIADSAVTAERIYNGDYYIEITGSAVRATGTDTDSLYVGEDGMIQIGDGSVVEVAGGVSGSVELNGGALWASSFGASVSVGNGLTYYCWDEDYSSPAAFPDDLSDAAGKWIATCPAGFCGGTVAWTLDGGTLTIVGKGATDDYTAEDPAPWHALSGQITAVAIGAGVTRVGSNAFADCEMIKYVSAPSGLDLSNTGIGAGYRVGRPVATYGELMDALKQGNKPAGESAGNPTAFFLTDNFDTEAGRNDGITVGEGRSVALDLNGQTLDCGGLSVYVEGALTLTDSGENGTITGSSNGGVCVSSGGEFNMSGGTISGNSNQHGGGVFVHDGATFAMTGGAITGNSSVDMSTFIPYGGGLTVEKGYGGGVYVGAGGTFRLSGDAAIYGNVNDGERDAETGLYTGGTPDDVYLKSNNGSYGTITVAGKLTYGTPVVVTLADGYGETPFTSGWGEKMGVASPAAFFTSGDTDRVPTSANGELTLRELRTVTTWADLTAALNEGGFIRLGDGVTPDEGGTALMIPSGKTVTLDLNGHTIDRALAGAEDDGYVIKVVGTLTLTDASDAKDGTITGGKTAQYGGGVYVETNGAFTMEGGTISGNTANYGGGGVYVNGNGTFEMTDGTISGNTAQYNGGGVYVNNDGTFRMSGGTISGNTASNGGGVYVYSTADEFTMIGGTISGNTANYGGGVYLNAFSGFEMTGGVITGNNADEDGGGVDCHYCSITVGGSAVISGNVKGGAKGENGLYAGGTASNALLGTYYNGSVFMPLIVESPLTGGAHIGVTMPPSFAASAFTSGLANGGENAIACFTSDDEGLMVVPDQSGELTLRAASVAGGTVCAPADAMLLVASYDNGRMTTVKIIAAPENGWPGESIADVAAAADYTLPGAYKLMLLGSDFAPLCEAWTYPPRG